MDPRRKIARALCAFPAVVGCMRAAAGSAVSPTWRWRARQAVRGVGTARPGRRRVVDLVVTDWVGLLDRTVHPESTRTHHGAIDLEDRWDPAPACIWISHFFSERSGGRWKSGRAKSCHFVTVLRSGVYRSIDCVRVASVTCVCVCTYTSYLPVKTNLGIFF